MRIRRFKDLKTALTNIGYSESAVQFSGRMIGGEADIEVRPFIPLLRPALDMFTLAFHMLPSCGPLVEEVTSDVVRTASYAEYRSGQSVEKLLRPFWSVQFRTGSPKRRRAADEFLTVAMTPLAPGEEGAPSLIFVASSSMDAMTRLTTIGRLAT